jgi:2,4-dienoyl-CoA reductase (NADPH2)
VGAIVSAWSGVDRRGFIVPGFASIENDERIPFWRELGRQVHAAGSKYILQLSHGGRQRDIPGIEYAKGLSSTDKSDPLHGFECERMNQTDIDDVVEAFAKGAKRAEDAGLDGVELHGANGYLITQFLSSAINDRTDGYGGTLANRARFVREIVRAIRQRVKPDFHVQMKISATEYGDALDDDDPKGNTVEDAIQVCQWLVEDGIDAIHVSAGHMFPHPKNPAGDLALEELRKTYDSLISSGTNTFRNYVLFRSDLLGRLFQRRWENARGDVSKIEGMNLPDAEKIKAAVTVPVLCTGGFQTAAIIRDAIDRKRCDAVTIARPLIANNNLVEMFKNNIGRPPKPCTYCNKCLVNAVENPLGCYEESRFPSREAMIQEIMTVFDPPPFH